MKMKSKTTLRRVLPVVAGGLLGYAYYYFIGCNSGTCPITSSPYISTIYGSVVGLILVMPGKKKKKKEENEN